MKYLPHQQRLIETLEKSIDENKMILIEGDSGCGKTTACRTFLTQFASKGSNILILSGDSPYEDRSYTPFKKGLFSMNLSGMEMGGQFEDGILESLKGIPAVGNTLSFIMKKIMENKEEKNILKWLTANDEECEIIVTLKYILDERPTIIFIDNIQYWDNASIRLLFLLLEHKEQYFSFLKKATILICNTPDQVVNEKAEVIKRLKSSDDIRLIQFPLMSFEDFQESVSLLGLKRRLQTKELEMFYKLIDGHLQVMQELIIELNNENIKLNDIDDCNIEYLSSILSSRLKEFGATMAQTELVLEYASIIGMSFSAYELERITRINSDTFRIIIENANSIKIIEPESREQEFHFVHEIIRQVFKSKTICQPSAYYLRLEECLKEIKPAQYLRRARYCAYISQVEEAAILFALEYIRQLRLNSAVEAELEQEAKAYVEGELYVYCLQMKEAFRLYDEKDYSKALECLENIPHFIASPLIAEADILKSFCFNKMLDSLAREKSLKLLDEYKTIEDVRGEKDVWERILARKRIINVHLGDIDAARSAEKKLYQSVENRKHYDEETARRIGVLKRCANATLASEFACKLMKEAAIDFSKPDASGKPMSLRDSYISNVNYTGILLEYGQFAKAFEIAENVIQLEQRFDTYPFPRTQIAVNNYLLARFLCGKISAEECAEILGIVVGQMPCIAERLFFSSNLSIFLSLSGQVEKGLSILEKEASEQCVNQDPEGEYEYKAVTNCAVYYYLLGKRQKGLVLLKKLKEHNRFFSFPDGSYLLQKHKIMISIMEREDFYVSDPTQWLTALKEECPVYQNSCWEFTGLGYAFTTLYNWDE